MQDVVDLVQQNPKVLCLVTGLALIWTLESWWPLFTGRPRRVRHAGRNLAIAALNTFLLAMLFAGLTARASAWASMHGVGLLHQFTWPAGCETLAALLLFDAWMYLWHRANHVVPFLWRFHRTHHSDLHMDVTTGVRFHPGEIMLSALIRLAVLPLLGMSIEQLVLYELILLPVILFHHSNVGLPERWDRVLRALMVTPNMHRVHHSQQAVEFNSNFSSVLSCWDRLGRTFHHRRDVKTLRYGLAQFRHPAIQTVKGMLLTPLSRSARRSWHMIG